MFILAIILAVLTVAAVVVALAAKDEHTGYDGTTWHPRRWFRIAAGVGVTLTIAATLAASLYSQSVGQAKVLINAGGTIAGQDSTPGFAAKAPWQKVSTWDLFSQSVVYAGNSKDGTPEYTGGQINGYEITSSVAGGAQTNFDLSVTYNLDGAAVGDLYRKFRTQERFTKQVVEPQILAVVRDVPTAYRPVDFRGEKRGEATIRMTDDLNDALDQYGITVTLVNLQNIRFTDEVEASIKNVEVAQQKEAEAEANLRATQVSAQAKVVEAQAEADANAILSQSLTPQVLQQRYIDAIAKAGTVIVTGDGATPLVQVPPAAAK